MATHDRYSFEEEEIEDPYNTSHNDPSFPLPRTQPPIAMYNNPTNVVRPIEQSQNHFERLRAQRRNSGSAPAAGAAYSNTPASYSVPAAAQPRDQSWGRELANTDSIASNTTPGADNFGEQAAGGLAGLAFGVADTRPRESGMEAMRNTPGYDPREEQQGWGHREEDVYSAYNPTQPQPTSSYNGQQNHTNNGELLQRQTSPQRLQQTGSPPVPAHVIQPPIPLQNTQVNRRPLPPSQYSQGSLQPVGASLTSPGPAPLRSPHDYNGEHGGYSDTPYNRYSRNYDPAMGTFDPNSIADDGDDGLIYEHRNQGSLLSLGNHSHNSSQHLAATSNAGPVATGGVMGTLGGLMGRSNASQPAYNPVNANTTYDNGAGLYAPPAPEKSEWLETQSTSRKKWKWVLGAIVILSILGGIAAAVAVPLINKKNSPAAAPSTSSGQTAANDQAQNGDLNKDSSEIKALLNNPNLHKVFPGIDYTPINTQYPDCMKWPPSQNNVTRDMAVLSQLTNIVRLYGTDCNQTEMVMHSIDALGLNGTVKVWLGVWQDTNTTTNARQLAQMYTILETYGPSSFEGVIVGNEVLFRQDLTITALGTLLADVRANFTKFGYNLPVATSDLGDNWTAALAEQTDYVMANVHPFFAGVEADVAAGWTWDFWQNHDAAFKTDKTKNIISETGWPSSGGTDCGGATTCVNGSVAGIDEMNTFMDSWVCQALTNGTNYFWFEAFDEPWKILYDTPGKAWEDQWGLMDINRNLKKGVKIPDCGGKTVPNVS